MIKHTPGPWEIKKSPFEVYNVDHGALTHHVVSGDIMITALYVHHESHDARLIAEAPELLSLLKEARSSVDYQHGMQNTGIDAGKRHAANFQTLLDRIDAAIAKVTAGEVQ